MADILHSFRASARKKLLEGYQQGLRRSLEDRERALLDILMQEKAAYEVCYDAAYRPDWLGVPLRGLVRLATSLAAPEAVDA